MKNFNSSFNKIYQIIYIPVENDELYKIMINALQKINYIRGNI